MPFSSFVGMAICGLQRVLIQLLQSFIGWKRMQAQHDAPTPMHIIAIHIGSVALCIGINVFHHQGGCWHLSQCICFVLHQMQLTPSPNFQSWGTLSHPYECRLIWEPPNTLHWLWKMWGIEQMKTECCHHYPKNAVKEGFEHYSCRAWVWLSAWQNHDAVIQRKWRLWCDWLKRGRPDSVRGTGLCDVHCRYW